VIRFSFMVLRAGSSVWRSGKPVAASCRSN